MNSLYLLVIAFLSIKIIMFFLKYFGISPVDYMPFTKLISSSLVFLYLQFRYVPIFYRLYLVLFYFVTYKILLNSFLMISSLAYLNFYYYCDLSLLIPILSLSNIKFLLISLILQFIFIFPLKNYFHFSSISLIRLSLIYSFLSSRVFRFKVLLVASYIAFVIFRIIPLNFSGIAKQW